MEVDLNGRKIDLSKAFPLKVADWRALSKLGITPDRLAGKVDVEALCGYALFVLMESRATAPLSPTRRRPEDHRKTKVTMNAMPSALTILRLPP